MWDPDVCIQCGKCVMVCPHAVIRSKVYAPAVLDGRAGDVQVARCAVAGLEGPERTRSRSRSRTAPAAASASMSVRRGTSPRRGCKAINMQPQPPLRETEQRELGLLSLDSRTGSTRESASNTSASSRCSSRSSSSPGACAGCGETPISSCSRSSLAIGSSSPMPPAARRFTAAICRRRPGRKTPRAAVRPGATRCSRTTPSSASASASRSTSSASSPESCSPGSRRRSANSL